MKRKPAFYLILFFVLVSTGSMYAQKADSAKIKQADTLKIRKSDQSEKIYQTFDEPPQPPGGQEGYLKFLQQNIRYPQDAVDANAQGTVYISIIVDKDGTLSDVHVIKDVAGYGCGEEAVRVIKNMPPWKPGKMNGVPVKVRYTIPVKFSLK